MRHKTRTGGDGSPNEAAVRGALLTAARRHAERGQTYLATSCCLKLLREHPATVEAREAAAVLLEIAQTYDAEGKKFHARSLYRAVSLHLPAGGPAPHAVTENARAAPGTWQGDAGPLGDSNRAGMAPQTAGHPIHAATIDGGSLVDLSGEVEIAHNSEQILPSELPPDHSLIPAPVESLGLPPEAALALKDERRREEAPSVLLYLLAVLAGLVAGLFLSRIF